MTLLTVKVFVSIPDGVFRAAERLSKRMRISRSQLYARAVEACVKSHAGTVITKRLDQVYSNASSRIEPAVEAATLELHRRERWD